MKEPSECPRCRTHGAWAVDPRHPQRFCACGQLGADADKRARERMLYRFLVETMVVCGACKIVIRYADAEACFWCVGDLCATCWDAEGHCGEPEAAAAQAAARAWKPGDPLLPIPYGPQSPRRSAVISVPKK